MKIKKKLFLIIIVLLLLIIMLIVIAGPSETSKTQALSPVSQETIEVNQNSDDYLEGIDGEYYWGYVGSRPWLEGAMITKGNDGYYYYDSSNSLLCYFDSVSGRTAEKSDVVRKCPYWKRDSKGWKELDSPDW